LLSEYNGWQVTAQSPSEAVLQSGQMWVSPYSGYRHRPTMLHTFPEVTGGKLQADITYNWSKPPTIGSPFGILMQLGQSDATGGSFGSYIDTSNTYPASGSVLGLLWYQTNGVQVAYYSMPSTTAALLRPVTSN
jgi:hypothetical protein